MKTERVHDLLYQSLECELGGLELYPVAIRATENEDLREEWEEYLEQTREHKVKLLAVFEEIGLDPDTETTSRTMLRTKVRAALAALESLRREGDVQALELFAAESVLEAETKDHMNWTLLHHVAEEGKGPIAKALKMPTSSVLEEEAEHRFHTEGWARELWMEALGLPAALPPPEEEKSVKTKMGAGRAENQRESFI